MTTDDRTTARLDVPAAVVEAQLSPLHDRLLATELDGAHLAQVHEFLDIDPDIADRDYPPMPWARPAIPGLYPDTSSPEAFAATEKAGYVTPAYTAADCEPAFADPKPVQDVETGGAL